MPWKILSDPWEAGGGVPDGLGTLAFLLRQDFWNPFPLSFLRTHTLSLSLTFDKAKRDFLSYTLSYHIYHV